MIRHKKVLYRYIKRSIIVTLAIRGMPAIFNKKVFQRLQSKCGAFKAWLAARGAWQRNSAREEASFKDAGSNPSDALH